VFADLFGGERKAYSLKKFNFQLSMQKCWLQKINKTLPLRNCEQIVMTYKRKRLASFQYKENWSTEYVTFVFNLFHVRLLWFPWIEISAF